MVIIMKKIGLILGVVIAINLAFSVFILAKGDNWGGVWDGEKLVAYPRHVEIGGLSALY
jgi:hypothetical protein